MISIVVPVFNEEESLSHFYKQLMNSIRGQQILEVIFIDDGSRDSSLEILKTFSKKNKRVRIFSFRKNRGKSEALGFGFLKATGDTIVTLDADLQDDPTEIKKLLAKSTQGWDMVSGWRKKRKDTLFKVVSSKFFNATVGKIFGLSLHDYNCGLKLYKKDAAKSIRLYGGLHRFIPLLIHQTGFRVTEVAVSHNKRMYGKSKYGISKVWKDLPDMLTMFFLIRYSKRPLHFFGPIGGFLILIGFIIIGYFTILHSAYNQSVGARPLLFMGMILVISGFQTLFTGFLADLFINIAYKSNDAIIDSELKFSTR